MMGASHLLQLPIDYSLDYLYYRNKCPRSYSAQAGAFTKLKTSAIIYLFFYLWKTPSNNWLSFNLIRFAAWNYFKGIKFRGFRGFRENREIKSRRKIATGPSAKLNPHEKIWKIRLIREIFKKNLNKLLQYLFYTNGVFFLFLCLLT